MQSLKINQTDIQKVIKDSKQASKNLENYDKGEYHVNVNKINSKVSSVIGRKIDV